MAKQSIQELINQPDVGAIKLRVIQKSKEILKMGMLLNKNNIPPSLMSFPLNILGLLKHRFLTNIPQATVDVDTYNCQRTNLMHLTVDETMVNFVPYLFDVEDMNEQDVSRYEEDGSYIFPQSINLSFQSIQVRGIYLMDCGTSILMFVNEEKASEYLLNDIFGTSDLQEIFKSRNGVIDEENLYSNSENSINQKIYYLIHELRQ